MKFCFGRLLIRPNEFWEMRPKDVYLMVKGHSEQFKQQEEFRIHLTRELMATIYNNGFNDRKEGKTGADFWPLESDPKPDIPAVQEYTLQELQNIESLLANL